MLSRMVHIKCRTGLYPLSQIERLKIADEMVPWSVLLNNYTPPDYNSHILENKDWADPDIEDPSWSPKWNELDGKTNRKSHTGPYQIINKRPLNPEGRTGLTGRGILGKWGPNHAADPIVTRWKTANVTRVTHPDTKLFILQFCAILRRDCNEWALPGGMVDPGERVSETLLREFQEEALNSLEADAGTLKKNQKILEFFFKNGQEIFRGYVDDPRNTDNAWMETVAVNFHDENGDAVGKFNLQAGDDAKKVKWIDIDHNLNLYASHSSFIETVAKLHNAHW